MFPLLSSPISNHQIFQPPPIEIYFSSQYNIFKIQTSQPSFCIMNTKSTQDISRIQFMALSKVKVALMFAAFLAVGALGLMRSVLLAGGVPLVLLLYLLRMVKMNQKMRVSLMYQSYQWGHADADYLAVQTRASRQGGRHSDPKIFVEKIRSKGTLNENNLQDTKQTSIPAENSPIVEVVFGFKDKMHRATPDTIEQISEYQRLKLLNLTDIQTHLQTGLTDQLYALSETLFGEQNDMVTPSFWRLFLKNIVEKSGLLLTNLLASVFALEFNPQLFLLMSILFTAILILILVASVQQHLTFSQKYSWIQERSFTVIRNSQQKHVKVTDLMVGDVVVPESTDKSYEFWFGSVLAGAVGLLVKEGEQQVFKMPLREAGGLEELIENDQESLKREEEQRREAIDREERQILGVPQRKKSRFSKKQSRLHRKDSKMSPLKDSNNSQKDSKLSPLKDSKLSPLKDSKLSPSKDPQKSKQSRLERKQSRFAGMMFQSKLAQRDSRLFKTPLLPSLPLPSSASRHSIGVHSRVQGGHLKEDQRFLVIDHSCINRYFSRWFQKSSYREFEPLTNRYWKAMRLLSVVMIAVSALFYLVLTVVKQRSLRVSSTIINHILEVAALSTAFMLLAKELIFLWSRSTLKEKSSIFGEAFLQAGVSTDVTLNFSRLLHLQYEQTLYKNKLLGFQTELFQPTAQTLVNGGTYESLLAVIMYLSLGKFDQGNTLLSQVHKIFSAYYEYEDLLGEYPDIVHPSAGKRWELVRVLPGEGEGVRSWIVQYDNKAFYLICEIEDINLDCFHRLGEKEDSKKKETYLTAAKEMRADGKVLKALFFRNLKEERLSQSARPQGDYSNWQRQTLEKSLQFGCYLVFDHALFQHTVEQIQALKVQSAGTLALSFISQYGTEQLAGFEHLLTNIPFIYGCRNQRDVANEVREKMEGSGTVFLGGGVVDLEGLELADLGLRAEVEKESFCLPADVWLRPSWKAEDLSTVIRCSKLSLDLIMQTSRLILISAATAILTFIYFDRWHEGFSFGQNQVHVLALAIAVSCGLPMALRTFIQSQYFNEDKTFRTVTGVFTFSFVLALIFVGVISVVVVLFGQTHALCTTGSGQSNPVASLLRHPSHVANENCQNQVLFLATMAPTVTYTIFYGGHYWLEEQLQISRLVLMGIWAVAMVLMKYSLGSVVAVVVITAEIEIVKAIVRHFRK